MLIARAVGAEDRSTRSPHAEEMLDSDDQVIRQFLAGESAGPLGMD